MKPLDEETTRKRNWVQVNIQNDFRDKKTIIYKKCYDPIKIL
jgi:hypothetical protein